MSSSERQGPVAGPWNLGAMHAPAQEAVFKVDQFSGNQLVVPQQKTVNDKKEEVEFDLGPSPLFMDISYFIVIYACFPVGEITSIVRWDP